MVVGGEVPCATGTSLSVEMALAPLAVPGNETAGKNQPDRL
jgi:hypothetical protein